MITVEARTSDGLNSAGTPVTQSLHFWQNPSAVLPNLPAGGEQRYHVTVMVDEDVTTEDTAATFDFTFTGTQVDPTP